MKDRKALKEAYKQKKPTMGVFQILNKVNGKRLIEESTDIPAKWNRHQTELRFGSHRNTAFQKDWTEHGKENFEFSILSELEIKEGETLNIGQELKTLKEMVLEELGDFEKY